MTRSNDHLAVIKMSLLSVRVVIAIAGPPSGHRLLPNSVGPTGFDMISLVTFLSRVWWWRSVRRP